MTYPKTLIIRDPRKMLVEESGRRTRVDQQPVSPSPPNSDTTPKYIGDFQDAQTHGSGAHALLTLHRLAWQATARGSDFPRRPFRCGSVQRDNCLPSAKRLRTSGKRSVNLGGPPEGNPDVLAHRPNASRHMSRPSSLPVPLRLRRCAACGHPYQEHRGTRGCTVPKCVCSDFADMDLHPSGQKNPR